MSDYYELRILFPIKPCAGAVDRIHILAIAITLHCNALLLLLIVMLYKNTLAMSNRHRSLPPNQRTPSKWMLLSIIQSILFLFYVPILCKKYWLVLFGRGLSNEVAEVSLHVCISCVLKSVHKMARDTYHMCLKHLSLLI